MNLRHNSWVVGLLGDQTGVVAELAQVLKRLEDVRLALAPAVGLDDVAHVGDGLRVGEVVVELLLDVREVAVVVLDDLGRQVVQDILLESPKEERKYLLVQRLECESRCKKTKAGSAYLRKAED